MNSISLPSSATMGEIVSAIAPLPRDIVSDAFDSSLSALAGLVPMQIHDYPSGAPCFSWVVPQKWTCYEGWLETMDGTRLLDYRNSPLNVMSYSSNFEGVVSRRELMEHLEVHPRLDDAVPFVYSYFNKRWALCCTRKLRDSLKEDSYRVCIRTEFCDASLKVGEVIVPGESDSGFVLCAHLDHPGQANDGLSGVAVGIEVMRRLLAGPRPRHTIRLLIVSETFGSLAWLSNHMDLVPNLLTGMFLEMLGLEYPHALQFSQKKDTVWDRIARDKMLATDPSAWTGDFLKIITNDDRQFNAPGVRVPMLSLSRVQEGCGAGDGWPFAEYHSDLDNAGRVSEAAMEKSAALTLDILRAWDSETVPVPNYSAEPCLSRAGITFDFSEDPETSAILFDVIHAVDGKTSLSQIAALTGKSEVQLLPIVTRLAKAGLVRFPTPHESAS